MIDDDHGTMVVPEPAAINGDGGAHRSQETIKKEKSRCISSYSWNRMIVKWKREMKGNKDLGNALQNLSKNDSQLDELPGLSFALVYHTAVFRDELNKMAELQGQMQSILQNVENALATKAINPISPMKKVSHHLKDVSESSNQVAESRTASFVCENYHDCNTTTQERFSEGMDQLEEELESELEQLQLDLDKELMSKHEEERKLQMKNVLNTGARVEADEHNGVCPTELERRLHELFESRQAEKIKELEAALEGAKVKLFEKESEVSWWKNTASIISKHVPDHSFRHR